MFGTSKSASGDRLGDLKRCPGSTRTTWPLSLRNTPANSPYSGDATAWALANLAFVVLSRRFRVMLAPGVVAPWKAALPSVSVTVAAVVSASSESLLGDVHE